jgi:hypothetical protein
MQRPGTGLPAAETLTSGRGLSVARVLLAVGPAMTAKRVAEGTAAFGVKGISRLGAGAES